jgi:hypothetical protein
VKTTGVTTSILLKPASWRIQSTFESGERLEIRIRGADDEGLVAFSHDEPASIVVGTD